MKSIVDFVNLIKPYFAKASVVAPTESDATSSAAAYSQGEQLILNGVLYNVTAAIAIGDALTVGTNISAADDLTEQIAGKEDNPVVLTSTLTAGATTLTFTNAAIGNNSRIRAYSDPFVLGLITDMVQSGTSVTLTCAEQASNVSVKLEIRN